MPTDTLTASEIEQIAHRRAAARLGWIVHACVYLLANLVIGLLAITGAQWTTYPLLGWGMGLLAHGALVFTARPGRGLYQRMLRRERLRLQPRQDPW